MASDDDDEYTPNDALDDPGPTQPPRIPISMAKLFGKRLKSGGLRFAKKPGPKTTLTRPAVKGGINALKALDQAAVITGARKRCKSGELCHGPAVNL